MTKIVGLTGSIGMGKTTAGEMFADLGVPVFHADAVVHDLYAPGGGAVAPVSEAFRGVETELGIDRAALSAHLRDHPEDYTRLEAIVHPLVADLRETFITEARDKGAAIALLDIPLLYEIGAEKWLDAVIVVSARPEIQRQRVLQRSGMTAEKFESILARQTPDSDKRARADYVIDTGGSLEATRAQIARIHKALTGETRKQGA